MLKNKQIPLIFAGFNANKNIWRQNFSINKTLKHNLFYWLRKNIFE